jgi:hypothetical protein
MPCPLVNTMPDVTRKELKNILLDWQAGALGPLEVLEWAEEHSCPESLGDKVVAEILNNLDVLHLNLITVEDIPAFLRALGTSPEKAHEGLDILKKHDDSVDWEARKEKYKGHPIYGPML